MADIKFYCPECRQKIAVDDSAAGMQVDCPNCRSSLVIPQVSEAAVEITVRRRLVSATGHADSAFEELERKQKELASALHEAAQWRADTEQSRQELIKLREDLAATARERDGLRGTGDELNRLKSEENRFKVDLQKTREELAATQAERDELFRKLETRANEPAVGTLGLGSEHSVLQEQLAASEKARAELHTQLAAALGQKKGEKELLKQLAGVRDQLAATTAERESLRTKAGQAEDELKALRVASVEAQQHFEAERTKHVETGTNLVAAEQKIANLEKDLEQARAAALEFGALREQAAALRTELSSARLRSKTKRSRSWRRSRPNWGRCRIYMAPRNEIWRASVRNWPVCAKSTAKQRRSGMKHSAKSQNIRRRSARCAIPISPRMAKSRDSSSG